MKKTEKVEALKDPKLNPYLIKDGYDSLAHAYHLWTEVGAKAKNNPNISFTEQRKIADNFYDKIIGPAYGQLKLNPLSKELWQKQAYGEALNYKIEDAYQNDLISSIRNGWNSSLASTARAADRVSTVLGNTVDDVVALWRNQQKMRALPDAQRKQMLDKGWHEQLRDLHNQISAVQHEPNLIARGAQWQDSHRQFWADVLPGHDGKLNRAASFVAEQVGQAPVYAAMSLGGTALGQESLTATLGRTPLGKHVAGLLMAGTEGLAYGAAVRKQDDPGEMWRDAIGFAVFHGALDVGGMGLRKLIDMFPQGSKMWNRLMRRKENLDLGQEGKRPATPVEQYDMHKTEVANNLAAGGVQTQRAIYADALTHVHEMETVGDRGKIREIESKLLNDDPNRYGPVLSSARYIRTLLGDRKLSDIKPGSEEETALSQKLARLIVDAGSEMNSRVKGMDEAAEAAVPEKLAKPSAKITLDYFTQQVQQEVAGDPTKAKLVTPEMVKKIAQKRYAEALQKAASVAEEETGPPKVEKAQNVAKRRRDPEVKPGMKIRSERVEKGKDISVRYQVIPDYKVRFAQHKKAAAKAGKSLRDYFTDLDDTEFEKDITKYFYPKSLKSAKVFFEHQNTKEGMQNPNFLAFMHNYQYTMPEEFAKELQERLIGTMKVQKYMNGRNATDSQLDYFAKAMYNHVDNFLGSGRWPKETNIFRSSNQNMFKTTRWQRKLLVEKTLQEQANLKEMFSGDKKALNVALNTHAELAKSRMKEFDQASIKRGSQDIIRGIDEKIADLQTSTGYFTKWRF